MKKVALRGTDIITTPIGFGCAGLMRTATSKGRQRILDAAYDSGIRHYDVARMYGLGQVEAEVGKFIKRHRNDIVITTKFGINVSQRSRRLTPVINVARHLIKLVPSLRAVVNNRTPALYQDRTYDAATAQMSLEKSISELDADFVDLFMLHEPSLAHLENTDLLEFLENAKDRCLIRSYGIAGYAEDCLDICTNKPELVDVLQIPNDLINHQIDLFDGVFNGSVLTFSPFSNSITKIVKYLKDNPVRRKQWSEATGCDCGSPEIISKFLLKYCINDNPEGVVLFSTSKVERIPQLVNVYEDFDPGDIAMSAFTSLVREQFSG